MNEKRLTFGEFVDEVRRSIKDYLPEKFADAEVHVDQFQKLNTAYLGMQVKREDQMVVPNINLNGMYAQYQEQGHTMAAMLTMIAQQVQMAPEIRTDWLKDYSQVKDHLFIRVSDAKENEGVLKNAPHKEVDGLAVSYHIAIEGMQASTPVTYQMMEMYGVTAEQLHADALESTQKLYPVKYASMAEVMQQMMGIEPDMAADMMPPMEGPQLMVRMTEARIWTACSLWCGRSTGPKWRRRIVCRILCTTMTRRTMCWRERKPLRNGWPRRSRKRKKQSRRNRRKQRSPARQRWKTPGNRNRRRRNMLPERNANPYLAV